MLCRRSVLANSVKLNEKSGLKVWVSERHGEMILDWKLAETAWVVCQSRDFARRHLAISLQVQTVVEKA